MNQATRVPASLMTHRTGQQAALDHNGAWILDQLEKRHPKHLGLDTHEIGQVLD